MLYCSADVRYLLIRSRLTDTLTHPVTVDAVTPPCPVLRRCPALASLVSRLSGGGDPGFTYILQALSGHSQLTGLPERAASAAGAGDTGHGRLPSSAEALPRSSVRAPPPCAEADPETCEPSPWCHATLAGGGGEGAAPLSAGAACPVSLWGRDGRVVPAATTGGIR